MLFHEMNYVYEVYRQGSFTKAAQALFISQPSLSQMVQKAEARIGSPIFDRSTSPISLTETGRAYIRAVFQIMDVEANFNQYLNDTEHCLTGILTLGGTTFFTSYVLPPLVSAFSDLYPNVDIRLHEAHTSMLKRELQEGALDLVVDNIIFNPDVSKCHVYQSEQVLLAVPKHFPVNNVLGDYRFTAKELSDLEKKKKLRPVSLKHFSETPFLLLREGNATRTRADKLFAQSSVKPLIKLQLDQQLAAYNLAAYGLGAAFISDTLILNAPPEERLYFYNIASDVVKRDICFFHKANRIPTAPVQAFLDMLDRQ